MSILKNSTIKGISQGFIFRIERVTCTGKPQHDRYVIVDGKVYANDAAKQANDAIDGFSFDLRGPAAEAVLAASDKDMFAAAYIEGKKPGCLFEGGTDA
jgi:hypothetical protein